MTSSGTGGCGCTCTVSVSRSTYVSLPFFFFNDTATTEIYTLSLHDALPICARRPAKPPRSVPLRPLRPPGADRKSTRLNSSHRCISYAVFCLKKKKALQVHRDIVDTVESGLISFDFRSIG